MKKMYIRSGGQIIGGIPIILYNSGYIPDNTYYPELDLGPDPTSSFQGRIKYVTTTGAGLKDGSSWENAYDNIYSALTASTAQSTTLSAIYMEEGNYVLSANVEPKQGVSIYGGFRKQDKSWNARSPFKFKTILNANSGSYCINNTATFITNQIIDGITVKDKLYEQELVQSAGFRTTATLNLKHCQAINCVNTLNYGSGGYLIQNSSSVKNCIAINCRSRDGAGFSIRTSSIAENCVALNCSATEEGGGFNVQGTPEIKQRAINCIAINCSATEDGGGYCCIPGSSVSNCKAINCSSGEHGGGFYVTEVGGSIVDCEAINCSAQYDGGGVYVYPIL